MMNRYRAGLLLLVAAALPPITGCSLDIFRKPGARQVAGEPETLSYTDRLQVRLGSMTRTESGLYYQDRVTGTGATAEYGKVVSVGYVGSLADGRIFDQSRGAPIQFTLGEGEVILGWDEGIAGMKVGGRRLLVIRPSLAYGDASPGAGIPPNATLVFEVTLEGVER
jgi:FKBP-type peptidyl-prolyl cis-trans isomerase